MEISVSYLKSKYSDEETIIKIDSSIASSIHADLMDGQYVETKNNDLKHTIDILSNINKQLEIHLMMKNKSLKEAIEKLSILNPRRFFIPLDIDNLDEYIELINKYNIKVGLAIHPDSSIKDVIPYLDKIDSVLLMSVYPGRGGQSFLESSIDRLKELIKLRNDYNFWIGIDGGINDSTISQVRYLVDFAISGSFVCMNDNYNEQINKLL